MNTYTINGTHVDELNIKELIKSEENKFDAQICKVAEDVAFGNYNVIMLAGPSSAGKTTFSNMLKKKLMLFGKAVETIEMDNYYKDFDEFEYPINQEDGTYNFEHPDCLSHELMLQNIKDLSNGIPVSMPKFNFKTHDRIDNAIYIEPKENAVFIIEGIHALNPKFSIDGKIYKIYINTNSHLKIINEQTGNKILVNRRTTRWVRRTIRDSLHRGTNPIETMKMWTHVVNGEIQYINKYKSEADAVVNSTLLYEAFILFHIFNEIIDKKDLPEKYLKDIMTEAENFPLIDKSLIPKNSILNEFI